MKDLLLKASVKGQMMAQDAADRTRAAVKGDTENASVVENVIWIGIIVVAVVLVGGFLLSALTNQGEKLSNCIAGVNSGSCSQFE